MSVAAAAAKHRVDDLAVAYADHVAGWLSQRAADPRADVRRSDSSSTIPICTNG